MSHGDWGKASGRVFRLEDVSHADFSRIERLEVTVTLRDGTVVEATDIEALELAYATRPSVVEGRRMRHHRRAWALHNLVGHPLMQLLALAGAHRWAMWAHDATVPKVVR